MVPPRRQQAERVSDCGRPIAEGPVFFERRESGGNVSEAARGALFWWARSQRIRTAAEAPFEILLYRTVEVPVYQRIAARALQFRQLGLTPAVIARRLGASDKTATKAIAWIKGQTAK